MKRQSSATRLGASAHSEVEFEMIPYAPEELVEIANRGIRTWCEAEMKKASRGTGYGDDWKKALEAVKKYVEPAETARTDSPTGTETMIEFLRKTNSSQFEISARFMANGNDVARSTQLSSARSFRRRAILVSYPTQAMTHEQK